MRCPLCGHTGSLGILQQHRRRQGSHAVKITFFCNTCCVEFTARNDRVIQMVSIDDQGEVQPLPVPRATDRLVAHA